ncbi:MAG: tetratricopeptide repeat protein [Cyclobacteriaceae bacterium]|nr:tetratricopeptide repeat protein [Cyclobacteriaceae bacterium]
MPSVIPGYEYDIFVSYRHKDNRSTLGSFQGQSQVSNGWVTDFVEELKRELESTLKDDLSIYFDSNPIDGLLESHNVDKSLEGKLKAVIFIPILSQIYCDTKSFAWQNEFCAFNRMALRDSLGRDIKLRDGNVASRVLPVAIHNLDAEDRNLFETELNSKLRSIDFIFRSPGVNRPLRADDNRQDNANNLFYRDQINKVANAIKEIIHAIKYPGRVSESYSEQLNNEIADLAKDEQKSKSEQNLIDRSLAVLPFVSLSHDASQEYFADGITENILIQLSGNNQLRVISRTSVMRYKKTTKSAPEIATELGVKFILEGSAQAHGNKVRINVQLIDAIKDQPVWSKVFVESLDDIFEIQNSVAEVVSKELHTSINTSPVTKSKEVPTKNREAYDLFLKGRHAFNQWSVDGYRTASDYFRQALAKDPEFKQAYSYLASSFSARMSWNGDLSPQEAKDQIEIYLNEAWKRGPTDNDYLTKAFVEFFIVKDFKSTEELLLKAIELGPNNAMVLYTYSYLLNSMGRHEEAMSMVEKAKAIDPLTVAYFNYRFLGLYLLGRYDEALDTLKESLQLYPTVLRFYDFLGRLYLTQNRYEEAIDVLLKGLRTSKIRPPSMIAYLIGAYAGMNKQAKASELLDELLKRSEAGEKGVNIYLTHAFAQLGDLNKAAHWLTKARETNDIDLIWWNVDPLLKTLRDSIGKNTTTDTADFTAAEKYIAEMLEHKMPHHHYHNIEHVYDVLTAAQVIGDQEQLTDEEQSLLRLAALLHDSGFVQSPKNHEEKGVEIAKEILPIYGLSVDQINQISGMIMATKIPQTPTTHLEKILCDADLDYLGRDDFYDIGRRLLLELKEAGVVETEREWNLVQKTFLESHRYHTRFSKENREGKKHQHLQEISAKFRR